MMKCGKRVAEGQSKLFGAVCGMNTKSIAVYDPLSSLEDLEDKKISNGYFLRGVLIKYFYNIIN
jgi:hypothetical protein